jgi:3-oxoacyl-[acyl-carrier protein] reductase
MQKVALVTGGARGIGRGCALALARAGFGIGLVDVLEPEMRRTETEIAALGVPVLGLVADVADFARAQEVTADIQRHFGHIDFLLNNAGGRCRKGYWKSPRPSTMRPSR